MTYQEELKRLKDQNAMLQKQYSKCMEFIGYMVYQVESELAGEEAVTPWEELAKDDKEKANQLATNFFLDYLNQHPH